MSLSIAAACVHAHRDSECAFERHQPEKTLLYRTLLSHWRRFLSELEDSPVGPDRPAHAAIPDGIRSGVGAEHAFPTRCSSTASTHASAWGRSYFTPCPPQVTTTWPTWPSACFAGSRAIFRDRTKRRTRRPAINRRCQPSRKHRCGSGLQPAFGEDRAFDGWVGLGGTEAGGGDWDNGAPSSKVSICTRMFGSRRTIANGWKPCADTWGGHRCRRIVCAKRAMATSRCA